MAFHKDTVFVVGAGAHVDYGMPTGAALRKTIAVPGEIPVASSMLRNVRSGVDHMYARILAARAGHTELLSYPAQSTYLGHAQSAMNEVQQALGGSDHDSIDAFLNNYPTLVDAGRVIIACLLLATEREAISSLDISGWYRWFRKRALQPLKDERISLFDRASFVTFNYDRIAEITLATLQRNSSEDHSKKEIDPFGGWANPIHHVYGKLMSAPKWDHHARRFRLPAFDYSDPVSVSAVEASAKAIALVDDRLSTSEAMKPIRTKLLTAEQIVFVGFGFDETNLRVLGFPDVVQGRGVRLFSTGYGLKEPSRKFIEGRVAHEVVWGGIDQSCVSFLDDLEL